MIKQEQQVTGAARPQARATVATGTAALPASRGAAAKPAAGNPEANRKGTAMTGPAAPVHSRLTERRLRALAQDTRPLPKRYWRLRFPM